MDPTSRINYTPKDQGVRKTATGKAKKDFQKVLGKQGRDERNYSGDSEKIQEDKANKDRDAAVAAAIEEANEASQKAGGISLFDLAKPQSNPNTSLNTPDTGELAMEDEDIAVTGISEEMKQQSLSALFKGYGTKEKLKSLMAQQPAEGKDMPVNPEGKVVQFPKEQGYIPSKEMVKVPHEMMPNPHSTLLGNEKGRERIQFTTREQPDLSSINPMAGNFQIAEAESVQESAQQQQTSRAADIQEMVDQIVQNIYTIKVDGKTDTLITLKQPPVFEGAHVVITGFDTAKGEFNIAFENLTTMAKQMLDAKDNQISLRSAMEEKGFVVHIITTTTTIETLNVAKGEQPSKGDREDGSGGFSGRREKKRDDEEAAG